MKKLKQIYHKFIYSNKLLKILRLFHFEKLQPLTLNIPKEAKCLLLAPHPDDETFGAGGVLYKYNKNFDVICLTDGRYGGYNEPVEHTAEKRKAEFEKAMSLYKVNSYQMLDIEDRKLIKNYEKFKLIPFQNYDFIFIPNYFDEHKDHKAITLLLQKYFTENKHKTSLKIVFYEVWSALALPNYFLNISDIIEKKTEAIDVYKSQTEYVDFMDGIISLNRYRGMLFNCKYAEAFNIVDIKTFMKF